MAKVNCVAICGDVKHSVNANMLTYQSYACVEVQATVAEDSWQCR